MKHLETQKHFVFKRISVVSLKKYEKIAPKEL